MINDTSSETYNVKNDEIVSIHNAYKKEFSRISEEHQYNLNSLEKCYKEQILSIIKEKDSISLQLLSIFQSLYEHFQHKLKKLRPKSSKVIEPFDEKINFINETYQCIINSYENKQQDLFKEILELKKIIMEEKKKNLNISSIHLIEKENSILKQHLNSNNLKRNYRSELTAGIFIWCLGVLFYQKKDKILKEHPKIVHLLEFVLVITITWHLGKFEDRGLALLNIVICGIVCCILSLI
ncbi:uncharacterized protein MAL7P1.13-like isoform X2 [Melanaphis sacchari]|uniref:uncharacterized protein MAL7P1.13-like isoform X2 n=1 Tax=Melanaphis sacchari TaxID=742174 RepID=UPI000DC13A32|nr:uncharacterized protein MAL7P1.13-like isoform X2 [Melanaphis sacchari]